MKIAITTSKDGEWIKTLQKSCKNVGYEYIVITEHNVKEIRKCDAAVIICYNHNVGKRILFYRQAKKNKVPIIYLDRGPFSIPRTFSICINAPKMEGVGYSDSFASDSSRWELYKDKVEVRDWKSEGDCATILVHNVHGYRITTQPVFKQIKKIRLIEGQLKRAGHSVRISYHPNSHLGQTLDIETIREMSKFCVGWHTNALCDMVISGVPIVSLDPQCFAYNISSHDINNIITPDRQQWLNQMSWVNWHKQEIIHGDFWEVIKPYLGRRI